MTESVQQVETAPPPHVEWKGIPFFFAGDKDIISEIEKHYSYTHYYILAEASVYNTEKKTNVKVGPRVFMVINNALGRSIQPVPTIGLAEIDPHNKVGLPRIPRKMIKTIETFFREIDKRNSTESIVILTYDTAKTGADGWGWVVPDQKNTSTHCNYEPQSLIALIPNDTTLQVGTAHSHPHMSAYKSGTDEADQKKFGDGIHMTYGWTSKNRGEWYCEVQFGNSQEVVSTDFLFEDYDYDVDVSTLEEDMKRVSKSATGAIGQGSGSGYSPATGSYGGTGGFGSPTVTKSKARLQNLPSDGPDKDNTTIVVPVFKDNNSGDTICWGCKIRVTEQEVARRKCVVCKTAVYLGGESLADVVAQRKANAASYEELDIEANPAFPIAIWRIDDKGVNTFDFVYTPASSPKN